MLRRGKQIGAIALLLMTSLALTGCNDYVNERLAVPGTNIGIPMALVWFGALFFNLIGPVVTAVVLYKLFFWRRKHSIGSADSGIELYVSRRKFPVYADAIIVPVAPDLKMVFGVAKMVRDYGADTVQYEANQAAPLPPGQAFIGTGGRYRFKNTVLAVIFDEQKRTSPQLIAAGLGRALQLAHERGAKSVIIPDITENLLAQPNAITAEQRRQTAELTARLIMDAVLANQGTVKTIRIWVFDPNNAEYYRRELQTLAGEETIGLAHSCKIRDVQVNIVSPHDLDHIQADAFLNPTTTTLQGSSVSAALVPALAGFHRSGNAPVETAQLATQGGAGYVSATRTRGPIPVGDAALDEATELPFAAHTIHLACRTPESRALVENIRLAVQSALVLADEKNYRSLVIANPGAGENDYPASGTGPVVTDAIRDYLYLMNRHSQLETIYLLATTKEEAAGFGRAIGRFLPWPFPTPGPAKEH